jgi:hypothetical protein
MIPHLAFYVGWPNAMSAVTRQGAARQQSGTVNSTLYASRAA